MASKNRIANRWSHIERGLRRATGFVFSFLLAASGFAQDLRFEKLSIEHGLSQSVVNDILQDEIGFMWFATQDGLNVYDGYQFQVFQQTGKDGDLSNSYVMALAVDGNLGLWVGTYGGGLNHYLPREKRFQVFRHDENDPKSLSEDFVFSLLRDQKGRLLVGTANEGLNLLKPDGSFQHFRHDPEDQDSLSADRITALHQDRLGRLWVGTTKGLDRFDLETGMAVHAWTADDGYTVRDIKEDGEGRLWLATWGAGLIRFDPAQGEIRAYRHRAGRTDGLCADQVKSVVIDQEDRIWIGTLNGLNRFDPKSNQWQAYRHHDAYPHSLGGNHLVTMEIDRTGVLWAATAGSGLNKLDPTAEVFVNYYAESDGLQSPIVFALHEDRDKNLWVGTYDGGLHRYDRERGEIVHYGADLRNPNALAANQINVVTEAADQTIWVGSFAGVIHRYDRVTDQFVRYGPNTPEEGIAKGEEVTAAGLDSNNRLWFTLLRGGPHYYDPESDQLQAVTITEQTDQTPEWTTLAARTDGGIWLGTRGHGIFLLFDQEIQPIQVNLSGQTLPPGANVIYEDDDHRLWVGTDLGLVSLKIEDAQVTELKQFGREQGIANEVIYGILPDEDGRLWLSCNRGLIRFDPLDGETRTFDVSNGLQSNEFNQGAFHRTRGGELLFGGINGFNAFYPSQIKEQSYRAPLALTAFMRFNRPVLNAQALHGADPIQLTYQDSVVSFSFAAMDFANPKRNRFAYKLEGFQEEWIELGTKNEVTFTNLDPGRYLMRVRGTGSNGVWNDQDIRLPIIVVPPMWKTWWAYLIYALLTIAVLVSAHFWRINTLNRRKRELADLVADRTLALRNKNEQLREKNLELRETNRELETLDEVVKILNREQTLDALLSSVLQELLKLCPGADRASFLRRLAHGPHFMFEAVAGTRPERLLGSSLSETDIQARYIRPAETLGDQLYLIRDFYYEEHDRHGSLLGVGLRLEGETVGYLVVEAFAEVAAFDETELARLFRLREHAVSAFAKARTIEELTETTRRLKDSQTQLLKAAHFAGMAEIAESVLHNIGNTLNSVNTSAELILDQVQDNKILTLYTRLTNMVREHQNDLGRFLDQDVKGKLVPEALFSIAEKWQKQNRSMFNEIETLMHGLVHIRRVISAQQEHTLAGDFYEEAEFNEIIEDVLRIQSDMIAEHQIHLRKLLGNIPVGSYRKSKVLHILLNLLKNAVEAVQNRPLPRLITIESEFSQGQVTCRVTDNGIGIEPREAPQIFAHGYTTKKEGQGFGLHYCGNAAKEMGGSLHFQSEGREKGAAFTLELPLRPHGKTEPSPAGKTRKQKA